MKTHDELRELCDKATPGPWYGHDCYIPDNSEVPLDRHKCSRTMTDTKYNVIADIWGADRMQANVDFIAAARTAIPQLLDEIERLRSQKPPCSNHCYHHQTHPCEKCGRISGFIPLPEEKKC